MRFLAGSFDLGPFHGFMNELPSADSVTTLHKHKNDHLLVSPSALKIEAIVNGNPVLVTCEADSQWWNCWLIKAGVAHKVSANGAPGRFICLFSHYDDNGKFQAEPKASHPDAV